MEALLLEPLPFPLGSFYLLPCLFGSSCLFILNSVFFLPPWGICYSLFSSFGSLEFQYLVETSYFVNFLYLGIHYPFHCYICVPQLCLSQSKFYISTSHFLFYNYALLVCVYLQTVGLYSTPTCVFLSIPLFVTHICCTPFLHI